MYHNRHIAQHAVFRDIAQQGKTSVGWFYGFKLHLVCNDYSELLAATITLGNVDNRQKIPQCAIGLHGKLVAGKGYISAPLATDLWKKSTA